MWCTQCRRERPPEHFLQMRDKRWRVTKCNDCAQKNMSRWANTRNVGKMPDEIKEADE